MTEEELIDLVMEKTSRSRYKELLKRPKQRKRLLDKLNHNPPIKEKYTQWYNTFQKALDTLDINEQENVRIISAADEIDGTMMTYAEALAGTLEYGWGTIIGISRNLAIYYGEEGKTGAVIRKEM